MKRLEVISPEYVFLKLKPNNSIRNQTTHQLARTIANFYKSFWNTRVREKEKIFTIPIFKYKKEIVIPTKMSFKKKSKVGYYIYMEKEKIEFYLIVPLEFYKIMKEKISTTWNGITVDKVEEIPQFSEEAYMYQMVYEKEDGLSLVTNRSDNDLLNASLNAVELLEDGDKAGIFYNFIPTSQGSFKFSHQATVERTKKGIPTDRNKLGFTYVVIRLVNFIDYLTKMVAEAFVGEDAKQENGLLDTMINKLNGGEREVKSHTKDKVKGQILNTQIVLFSEGAKTKIHERSYVTSIAQSFDVLSGDNRLVGKRYSKKFDLTSTYLPGVEVNKMWDEEIQSFISLPGRELLERFPFIDKVETQETQLPKDLQTGVKCIGKHTYRGHLQKAFLTEHEQFRKLALILIGPSRAGKSNLISHLCIDAVENKESVFALDFISENEMSDNIARLFPGSMVLRIGFDDLHDIQGLGFNEVGRADTPFERYINIKHQANSTMALINAINIDTGSSQSTNLSPKMARHLLAACSVVYTTGGSIDDIFEVLQNHIARSAFIQAIPKDMKEYLKESVSHLREIDEVDSKTGAVTGTKYQASIMDRLDTLKRNAYMEMMLKKGIEENIDLVEEIQKPQVIIIQIPESKFPTAAERDVVCTYWMSKIWLALQLRKTKFKGREEEMTLCNIIVDEIYQIEHTTEFIKKIINQVAKFGGKAIISCHYLNQLKGFKKELKGSNASYMLVAGSNTDNYKEMSEELAPLTAADLLSMKTYHSMNYIKTADGYASFITELPGKVENRKLKQLPPP